MEQAHRLKRVLAFLPLFGLLLLSGCRLIDPPSTPAPIIITATPPPTFTPEFTPTPDQPPTPVLGALPSLPPLPTATATALPTRAPTLTLTFTPTFTDTPAPTVNVKTCKLQPQANFVAIYARDSGVQQALGCALGPAVNVSSALQDFETGRMIWVSQIADVPTRTIYTVYANGSFQRYPDTWAEGIDPVNPQISDAAPAGRFPPIRGFGKVWGTNPGVRSGLGWAVSPESGTGATIQRFERGEMVFIASLNQSYILVGGGWRVVAG